MVALNVDVDLRFFDMIVPCGLQHRPSVTSLAAEIASSGASASLSEAQPRFMEAFAKTFDCDLVDSPVDSIEQIERGLTD